MKNLSGNIIGCLSELSCNIDLFCVSLKKVFKRKLTRAHDCREYFLNIFSVSLKISLTYMELDKLSRQLPGVRAGRHQTQDNGWAMAPQFKSLFEKEGRMRGRFKKAIESLPGWSKFRPINHFAEENLLFKRKDYVNRLVLHLPEIYGELLRLKKYIRRYNDSEAERRRILTHIIGSLEHVTHHISYCHYALEALSNDYNWE